MLHPNSVDTVLWRRRSGGRAIQRGLGKLGVVNWDILLHLIHLNGRSASRLRKSDAKRDLYTVNIAVIGVVDLSGIAAKRRLCVTHEADEQA